MEIARRLQKFIDAMRKAWLVLQLQNFTILMMHTMFCTTCLLNYGKTDVIRYITDRQEQEFERLGISFKSLWGRPLQLIDCQNLFCETDKYSRVAHPEVNGISNRTRIKQLYTNTYRTPTCYFFPPKWNLNDKF